MSACWRPSLQYPWLGDISAVERKFASAEPNPVQASKITSGTNKMLRALFIARPRQS